MNKKGYFFFIQWGTETKQEQFFGTNLDFKCPCKNKLFNLTFNLERSHIFWVIPISSWSIEDTYIQCSKCGRVWEIEGKQGELQELYNSMNTHREFLEEGNKSPYKNKYSFDIKARPLFTELSKNHINLKEKNKREEEIKREEKEETKNFIRFLKGIGIIIGILIILVLIRAFIIA